MGNHMLKDSAGQNWATQELVDKANAQLAEKAEKAEADRKATRAALEANLKRKYLLAGGEEGGWSVAAPGIIAEALKAASLSEDEDDAVARMMSASRYM